MGAGTGLFCRAFGEKVGPTGVVYGVDISPAFVELMSRELEFVKAVLCDDKKCNLEVDAGVDVAFICDVYHHLTYPKTYMRSVLKSMKEGGKVRRHTHVRTKGRTI